jgi:hypothetical protein
MMHGQKTIKSTCRVFMIYRKKILHSSGLQCRTKSSEGLSVSIIKVEYYIVRKMEWKTGTVTMDESKGTCWTKNVLFSKANVEGIFRAFTNVSVKYRPPVLIVTCSQPLDPDV